MVEPARRSASPWWAPVISGATTRGCIASSQRPSSWASVDARRRARRAGRRRIFHAALPDIGSARGQRGRGERGRAHRRARARRLPAAGDWASMFWSRSPWPLRWPKPTICSPRRAVRDAFCRSGTWSDSIPRSLAVMPILNHPLYFEVHRLGVFTPRSLDIDVVYDVMIHDLDILLALVDAPVTDIQSRGHSGSDRQSGHRARAPDFASGAVANVTASRVSTERVRKMRFFPAARIYFPGLRAPGRAACRGQEAGTKTGICVPKTARAAGRAFTGRTGSICRRGAHATRAPNQRRNRPRRIGIGRTCNGKHPGAR